MSSVHRIILISAIVTVHGMIQNITLCFLLESDSYYTSYERVAPAVELGIRHANEFVLPPDIRLNYVYQSLGMSCTAVQHSALVNVLRLLATGQKCDAFLGVGELTKYIKNFASFCTIIVILYFDRKT